MNSAGTYLELLRQECTKRGIEPPKHPGVPFSVGKMYREDMVDHIVKIIENENQQSVKK